MVEYDFTPEAGDDVEEYLTLRHGDVLQALPSTDEWWLGCLRGKTGYFPVAFVHGLEQ